MRVKNHCYHSLNIASTRVGTKRGLFWWSLPVLASPIRLANPDEPGWWRLCPHPIRVNGNDRQIIPKRANISGSNNVEWGGALWLVKYSDYQTTSTGWWVDICWHISDSNHSLNMFKWDDDPQGRADFSGGRLNHQADYNWQSYQTGLSFFNFPKNISMIFPFKHIKTPLIGDFHDFSTYFPISFPLKNKLNWTPLLFLDVFPPYFSSHVWHPTAPADPCGSRRDAGPRESGGRTAPRLLSLLDGSLGLAAGPIPAPILGSLEAVDPWRFRDHLVMVNGWLMDG